MDFMRGSNAYRGSRMYFKIMYLYKVSKGSRGNSGFVWGATNVFLQGFSLIESQRFMKWFPSSYQMIKYMVARQMCMKAVGLNTDIMICVFYAYIYISCLLLIVVK